MLKRLPSISQSNSGVRPNHPDRGTRRAATQLMKRSRNDIIALLKESKRNLERAEEIHRQLEALVLEVDRLPETKVAARRKPPK